MIDASKTNEEKEKFEYEQVKHAALKPYEIDVIDVRQGLDSLTEAEQVKLDQAISLERTIFNRRFGDKPEELKAEYERYLEQSVFFVVSKKGEPCGVLRTIHYGPEGLKAINDAARFEDWKEIDTTKEDKVFEKILQHKEDFDPEKFQHSLELATIGVDREKVGKNEPISLLLYWAFYQHHLKKDEKPTYIFAVLDDRVYEKAMDKRGLVMDPISKSNKYLGSPASTLRMTDFEGLAPRMKHRGTSSASIAHFLLSRRTPLKTITNTKKHF